MASALGIEAYLPEDYEYEVANYIPIDADTFSAVLHANIPTEADFQEWLQSFSLKTKTNWIVRRTFPAPKKYAFRKILECQSSNYHKVATTKQATRNSDCDAKIDCKVCMIIELIFELL